MAPFAYGSELSFTRPKEATRSNFVQTALTSWPPGKRGANGMHYESGFLKCHPSLGPSKLEWVVAHNFGVAEISEGAVSSDGTSARFVSASLIGASEARSLARDYQFAENGNVLREVVAMSTASVPEATEHLVAEYQRTK